MSNFRDLENSVYCDPDEMYVDSEEDNTMNIIQQIQDDESSLMSEVFQSFNQNQSHENFAMFSSTNSHVRIIEGYINMDEPELVNYQNDSVSVASHNNFSEESSCDEENNPYEDIESDYSYNSYETTESYLQRNIDEVDLSFQRMREVATSTAIILGTLLVSVIFGI